LAVTLAFVYATVILGRIVNIFSFKKFIVLLFLLIFNVSHALAESPSASVEFAIVMPAFLQIRSLTGEVLTANITDRTGNLYAPLTSKFRVISNSPEPTKLYLKANAITDAGSASAMFERGGRVYIAFTNAVNRPKSQSLANCMIGGRAEESPGVVAYPINSIVGAEHDYKSGDKRYEVFVENGTTDITVNIGNNVLKSSFASNDPNGFYQATLLLTEADI
jgi:hypothetical protein